MKKKKSFIRGYGFILAGLCALLLFTFWKSYILKYTLSGSNFMYAYQPWSTLKEHIEGPLLSDNADSVLPSVFSMFKSQEGISFWNSNIAMGDRQEIYLLLYPVYWFYKLPYSAAIMITTVFKFGLAFISMFAFLNSFCLKKSASFLGAVCFMFSPAMVAWLFWPHTYVICIAPFLFLATKKLVETVKLKYALWTAIVVGFMMNAGMPTYAAYFLYLNGFWLLYYSGVLYLKNDKKKFFLFWVLFILGVGLGAVISFPYTSQLLSSVGSNGYSESRSSYSSAILNIEYLRTMIVPYVRDGMYLHFNESTLYAGIVSIVLLPFSIMGIGDKKKQHGVFWFIMWIITMVLIFTHGLDWFYTRLPMIHTSLKTRIIVLNNFITCVLAAVNFNHLLEYKEKYRKNILRWLIPVILSAAFFVWQIFPIASYHNITGVIVFFIINTAAVILIIYVKQQQISRILVCAVLIINGIETSMFAQNYLPWVGKDVPVIPETTDTIEFLQENIDGQRYAAIGSWTLAANTSIYYGLDSIFSHGFINTNEDMKNYLAVIDDACFDSPTNLNMKKVDNEALLAYTGVKYVVDERSVTDIGDGDYFILDKMMKGDSYDITFDVPKLSLIDLKDINVRFATYELHLSEKYHLYYEWLDANTGKIIDSGSISCDKIKNDERIKFPLDETLVSEGQRITLHLYTDITDPEQLLSPYGNSAGLKSRMNAVSMHNGEEMPGLLALQYSGSALNPDTVGNYVYSGKDGLTVYEQEEYSDRIFLADEIIIENTEQEILGDMSEEYLANTLFVSKEEMNKENVSLQEYATDALDESESAEITKYSNDIVEAKVVTSGSRYLVLTDYYDPDWTAYVDGKEVDVIKGNYLFRTIHIEGSGEHTVTFEYHPKSLIRLLYISGIVSGIIIILLVCIYIREGRRSQKK